MKILRPLGCLGLLGFALAAVVASPRIAVGQQTPVAPAKPVAQSPAAAPAPAPSLPRAAAAFAPGTKARIKVASLTAAQKSRVKRVLDGAKLQFDKDGQVQKLTEAGSAAGLDLDEQATFGVAAANYLAVKKGGRPTQINPPARANVSYAIDSISLVEFRDDNCLATWRISINYRNRTTAFPPAWKAFLWNVEPNGGPAYDLIRGKLELAHLDANQTATVATYGIQRLHPPNGMFCKPLDELLQYWQLGRMVLAVEQNLPVDYWMTVQSTVLWLTEVVHEGW